MLFAYCLDSSVGHSSARGTCGSLHVTAEGGSFKVDVLIFIPTGGLEAGVMFFTLWLV